MDAETTDLLEEALARLPAGEGELRVRLLGQLASSLVWDPEAGPRRDTLSREAVAAARQIGDRATVARALIARHAAMGSPDALDERLSATREAMTIARDTGNPEVELYALMNHCSNLLEQGGPRAADRYMTRFRSMAEESRQAFFICTATSPALDGVYTAFGRVVDGMAAVDAIEAAPRDGETPRSRIDLKTVRIEKK